MQRAPTIPRAETAARRRNDVPADADDGQHDTAKAMAGAASHSRARSRATRRSRRPARRRGVHAIAYAPIPEFMLTRWKNSPVTRWIDWSGKRSLTLRDTMDKLQRAERWRFLPTVAASVRQQTQPGQ